MLLSHLSLKCLKYHINKQVSIVICQLLTVTVLAAVKYQKHENIIMSEHQARVIFSHSVLNNKVIIGSQQSYFKVSRETGNLVGFRNSLHSDLI